MPQYWSDNAEDYTVTMRRIGGPRPQLALVSRQVCNKSLSIFYDFNRCGLHDAEEIPWDGRRDTPSDMVIMWFFQFPLPAPMLIRVRNTATRREFQVHAGSIDTYMSSSATCDYELLLWNVEQFLRYIDPLREKGYHSMEIEIRHESLPNEQLTHGPLEGAWTTFWTKKTGYKHTNAPVVSCQCSNMAALS